MERNFTSTSECRKIGSFLVLYYCKFLVWNSCPCIGLGQIIQNSMIPNKYNKELVIHSCWQTFSTPPTSVKHWKIWSVATIFKFTARRRNWHWESKHGTAPDRCERVSRIQSNDFFFTDTDELGWRGTDTPLTCVNRPLEFISGEGTRTVPRSDPTSGNDLKRCLDSSSNFLIINFCNISGLRSIL